MENHCVVQHQAKGVLTLTLTRPNFLNALNMAMAEQLKAALQQAAQDEQIRCVVIQGAGGHFMAGGDLVYFASTLGLPDAERHQKGLAAIDLVHESIQLIRQLPKPVIAVAQGAVAGFGVSLLAACDLALAADTLKVTAAYNTMGLSPDGGFTFFLPRAIGEKRAKALTLLGDTYSAEQMLAWGLVNEVVSVEALPERTHAWTERLCQSPAHAVAQSKALLNASLGQSLEAQLRAEQYSFADCMLTADFATRVSAFVNKRRSL